MSEQPAQKHSALQPVQLRTLERVSFFKKTGNLFLYKKSERLMAAVFAVSDSVVSDTIREQVRAESVAVFMGVRDAIAARGAVVAADGAKLSLRALSLVALLEVSCRLGEISEGNYALLRGELVKLAEALGQNAEEADVLDRRILDDGLGDRPRRPASRTAGAARETSADEPSLPSVAARPAPVARPVPASPEGRAPEGMSFRGNVSDMMKSIADSIKDREEYVLDVVRNRGKVSIKDVLTDMPSVGEKTVQRVLSNLVAKGDLKKVGERRWSRYELAQSALGV